MMCWCIHFLYCPCQNCLFVTLLTTCYLLQYEDPIRQESARKTVPVEELQEKALVSLAKVSLNLMPFLLLVCLFHSFFLICHTILRAICWNHSPCLPVNRSIIILNIVMPMIGDKGVDACSVPAKSLFQTYWHNFILFILNFSILDILTLGQLHMVRHRYQNILAFYC